MTAPAVALVRRVAADARVRTASFAISFFAVVWANAAGYRSTYPKLADRVRLVSSFADNKAARILYGVGRDLTTVGGYTAWRAGGLLALFAGLFGIFAATRALRADEDSGRTELILSGQLTRISAFTAAMVAIALTIAALFVATALGAVAGQLSFGGSWFLALAELSVAGVYASVGAVTNQVFPTRRSALGAAGAVLAVDFLLRVVADTTDTFFVHWFSPLGWVEEARAFSGTRPIVLVLPALTIAGFVALATWLRNRRDVGAAFVAPRDTRPARTALLSSPFALAFRLDRLTIATWVGAVGVFGFVIGTVAKSVEQLDVPKSLREQVEKLGGIDITQAKGYVGLTFVIFVFAIALFVCGQLSAVRDEESTHRLETLFALPYGRSRWLQGRIVLVGGGMAACALLAGAGAGLGVVVTGGHMTFLEGLEAGANVIPAEVLFLGCGVLLLALVPRHGIAILYGFVGIAFVWDLFGALLSFPSWVLDLSPFRHVAPAPAKSVALVSAAVMFAIGAGTAAIGTVWFRKRDLVGD